MMEDAPPTVSVDSSEIFVVTLVGTMVLGAAVLVGLSWRHLRSRYLSPADRPIVVE